MAQTMQALLALGLRGHVTCAATLADAPVSHWVVIPSTRDRESQLEPLVREMAIRPTDELAIQFVQHQSRQFDLQNWSIVTRPIQDSHVLVIDDSWVSGARAQSVSSALIAAGAGQVSVLTVARVIDREYGPNQKFINKWLTPPRFDWQRCPWTGVECP